MAPARPYLDLNVTPLIDVLLVLLVIFLATLPIAQQGIDATVPAETERAGAQPRPDHIMIEYTADRQLTINTQPVAASELSTRLRDIYRERHDKTLFISAAATLRYREVMEVIDTAKGAGVERLGVVTEGMKASNR